METRWDTLRAHTTSADGRIDLLIDHLNAVANKGQEFASDFGAGQTGFLLGLLHDLGKSNSAFQDYLSRLEAGESLQRGPHHAVWGAALVYELLCVRCEDAESWKEFALPVAGHHGGLAASSAVALRLTDFIESHPSEMEQLRRILADPEIFSNDFSIPQIRPPGDREVFIRMLFSALVDADFLQTERHFSPAKVELRGQWPSLSELWSRFERNQANLLEEHRGDVGQVNLVRRESSASSTVKALNTSGISTASTWPLPRTALAATNPDSAPKSSTTQILRVASASLCRVLITRVACSTAVSKPKDCQTQSTSLSIVLGRPTTLRVGFLTAIS